MDVSRNGYYHYENVTKKKALDPEHLALLEWVKCLGEKSDYSYGSRRMKKALNALSYPVSRNKARKLMQEAGVKVRRHKKYKATTNSNHSLPVFENVLARQFDVEEIDQVYLASLIKNVA